MTEDVVFHRDGAEFVPSVYASGPWAADRMHGGPVFALLTRAVEELAADAGLIGTRLSFDLSRAVPLVPLRVQASLLRRSGRLCLVSAVLSASGEEYARVTALLLRPEAGELAIEPTRSDIPSGPDGLPIEPLMRSGSVRANPVRPGFHTRIETRWVPRELSEPLAIWFRLPIALVAGEVPSPLQRVAALADFTNAIAGISQRERSAAPAPGGGFVNVDATLYLTRPAVGEWLCLKERSVAAARGVSLAETLLFDEAGLLGTAQQARLAQRVR
jgi:hypothetical protein